MKVIITGATGFLGRNLAESLRAEGLDILATGGSHEVGRTLRDKGIDFHPADLLDVAQLEDAFAPADCVIHCAGKTAGLGESLGILRRQRRRNTQRRAVVQGSQHNEDHIHLDAEFICPGCPSWHCTGWHHERWVKAGTIRPTTPEVAAACSPTSATGGSRRYRPSDASKTVSRPE